MSNLTEAQLETCGPARSCQRELVSDAWKVIADELLAEAQEAIRRTATNC